MNSKGTRAIMDNNGDSWQGPIVDPLETNLRRFKLTWYGSGVLVTETDTLESYQIHYGPYQDARRAVDAIRAILRGEPAPAPYRGRSL